MASRDAEGAELNGKRFVLIVDVVSSGAILDAFKLLNADGLSVDYLICVIDRETDGQDATGS